MIAAGFFYLYSTLLTMSYLFPNYDRLPVTFAKGQGVWLEDTNGKRYLDALSGIAVCGLGHAHPTIVQAINNQSRNLLHTSNIYYIDRQEALAERLTAVANMDAAFFCNSGTEANEAAIKLARLYAHHQGNKRPAILVMQGGFHGRTLGSLAASDMQTDQFGPLPDGFVRIPFNDITAAENAIESDKNICAVLVEPIQGEGGVRIPAPDYLPALRQLCDQHQLLLMLDEVQTGVGRTGHWYCYQQYAWRPDILTTAKALGNGIPIGACLANENVASIFTPGTHGSTFGGNPLACAVGYSVLETIANRNLCVHAGNIGNYLLTELQSKLSAMDGIVEIRGAGLMIGIELKQAYPTLSSAALESGLLINVISGTVVRLLPPLIIEHEHADMIVERLAESIQKVI